MLCVKVIIFATKASLEFLIHWHTSNILRLYFLVAFLNIKKGIFNFRNKFSKNPKRNLLATNKLCRLCAKRNSFLRIIWSWEIELKREHVQRAPKWTPNTAAWAAQRASVQINTWNPATSVSYPMHSCKKPRTWEPTPANELFLLNRLKIHTQLMDTRSAKNHMEF